MLFYGLWIAALCLASFSLVMFGFGDGNLGQSCNESYNPTCDTVFRARATTFACLTWFSLFLAWQMLDMRRSFFMMQPGSTKYFTQWARDVWKEQILVLLHHVRFRYNLPRPLHSRHQRHGLQAQGHQLGVGHCLRGNFPLLPRY
jgi:hypothetical protein